MKKGFTLIEILLVITIIVSLSAFSYSALMKYNVSQSLDKDVKEVMTIMEEARSNTLSSLSDSGYGIHLETDKLILFKGATYVAGASDNRDTQLSGQTTLTWNLTGNTANIVFERLTGKVSATGTIVVSPKRPVATSSVITIFATGIVNAN